jgi:hypothetical protein
MKNSNEGFFRKDSRHNRQAEEQNQYHPHDGGFSPVTPRLSDADWPHGFTPFCSKLSDFNKRLHHLLEKVHNNSFNLYSLRAVPLQGKTIVLCILIVARSASHGADENKISEKCLFCHPEPFLNIIWGLITSSE